MLSRSTLLALAALILSAFSAQADDDKGPLWVTYAGQDGAGKGKHVVLISGDEEYRSEEALPQLGKILAKHHGFKCTVLFAIDPKTGMISPNTNNNIPGLEALGSADLMVIATRFRNLPDDQMKHIVAYLDAGKPVIGMRTATHAFAIPNGQTYSKYNWNYNGKDFTQGFGRQILGETWVNHHGGHGSQSTRGILAKDELGHPVLRGLKDGDIWGPTDVYTVHLPLLGDSKTLVYGQVLKGMKPGDEPVVGKLNDPMMPVAWVRHYTPAGDGKKPARVFTTTMGAATDLVAEGTRRMLVNAAYWTVGLENQIPQTGTDVTIVGEFHPTNFGFNGGRKGVRPADLQQ